MSDDKIVRFVPAADRQVLQTLRARVREAARARGYDDNQKHVADVCDLAASAIESLAHPKVEIVEFPASLDERVLREWINAVARQLVQEQIVVFSSVIVELAFPKR